MACNSDNKNSVKTTTPLVPNYAVASAHPLATQAGIAILKQGGNAFDAAIAVTSTLAVVEPYASGLGGGGFWLLHLAENNSDIMLDARETAPLAATRDMFLDSNGNPTNQSVTGPLAAGIPGVPAAIAHLSENYGRLPLSTTLDSAIQIARNGFPVSERYQKLATSVVDKLQASPRAAAIFLDQGKIPDPGFILVQPDLADVLIRIRDQGMDGFYRGEVADQLVKGVQKAGGIWQLRDLHQYKVKQHQPITGKYKNATIVSAALPSSGGIVLMQMLNMLSMFDLSKQDKSERMHMLAEIMRRAYFERAQYLGDADYVDVSVDQLLSMRHAEGLIANFSAKHATASQNYLTNSSAQHTGLVQEGANTTHFSIIDQAGNYVAATLSINYPFGSGFVPAGTGILLNNEMDDFSIKPGHPNLWGLIGSEANAIEPGKRMLSSMSPSFIKDGKRIAILGTPGGSRIITMVLLSTLEFIDGADVHSMVELARFHHQFVPDEIQFE
ncbi:MAG: gamma-glutamyltransferase, partial [Gammaproteobacteria bacterium]